MNEIKRRLMQGYVEMQDGTFAKEVNGELIPVHEDEANAFEPEMFVDGKTNRWGIVDRHEDCLYFKEAKVESHDERVEECSSYIYGGQWEDKYIREQWSCGCHYEEVHDNSPSFGWHDSYFSCRWCRMRQEVIQGMSDDFLTKYLEDLAQNGKYDNPFYMIAQDEWNKRHEKH